MCAGVTKGTFVGIFISKKIRFYDFYGLSQKKIISEFAYKHSLL